MRRNEAVAALAVAVLLLIAGLTWLLGPWGLLIAGAALAAGVLFADVKEGP